MKEQEKNINLLIEVFSKKYQSAYRNIKGTGKTKVLKYSSVVFKRWYYSALVDQTILSPANIISHQDKARKRKAPLLSEPAITPIRSGNCFKGFQMRMNDYSLSRHPVTEDLKNFLSYACQGVTLDREGSLSEKDSEAICPLLSQYDPFYADFLTSLSFQLKLLQKMPAIYTVKAVAALGYEQFFQQSGLHQIQAIIQAALQLSAAKLSGILPYPLPIFTSEGLLSVLQTPQSIDEIYNKIYTAVGVDFNRLWDLYEQQQDDEIGDYDYTLMCSTYCLGIMMDQWFITPFSQYLKLIQPLYFLSYSFENEIYDLYQDIYNNADINAALFSPCAYYSLTPLGEILVNHGEKAANYQSIPEQITAKDIADIVAFESRRKEAEAEGPEEGVHTVYPIKVKHMEDKRCWKMIEVTNSNTLHDLHKEICEVFGLDSHAVYSFFMKEVGNRFFEYTAPHLQTKVKKADQSTFENMELSEKQKFTYVYEQNYILELQVMKSSAPTNAYYPRTVRQSKRMAEMDQDLY